MKITTLIISASILTGLYLLYWAITSIGIFNLAVYGFISVTLLLLINWTFVVLTRSKA